MQYASLTSVVHGVVNIWSPISPIWGICMRNNIHHQWYTYQWSASFPYWKTKLFSVSSSRGFQTRLRESLVLGGRAWFTTTWYKNPDVSKTDKCSRVEHRDGGLPVTRVRWKRIVWICLVWHKQKVLWLNRTSLHGNSVFWPIWSGSLFFTQLGSGGSTLQWCITPVGNYPIWGNRPFPVVMMRGPKKYSKTSEG